MSLEIDNTLTGKENMLALIKYTYPTKTVSLTLEQIEVVSVEDIRSSNYNTKVKIRFTFDGRAPDIRTFYYNRVELETETVTLPRIPSDLIELKDGLNVSKYVVGDVEYSELEISEDGTVTALVSSSTDALTSKGKARVTIVEGTPNVTQGSTELIVVLQAESQYISSSPAELKLEDNTMLSLEFQENYGGYVATLPAGRVTIDCAEMNVPDSSGMYIFMGGDLTLEQLPDTPEQHIIISTQQTGTVHVTCELPRSYTSMSNMFNGCTTVTGIEDWDTSNITNMSGTFNSMLATPDISRWDVSNVTDMSYMFAVNKEIDVDLSNWDISKVTNLSGLFRGCEFNGTVDLSAWDISSVVNLDSTFGLQSGTVDITGWKIPAECSVRRMFYSCNGQVIGIETLDVSEVTNMERMFEAAEIDINLSQWDVSNVTNMYQMFVRCINFTGGGLETWDVSNVTDMQLMFSGCSVFNGNISQWTISEDMPMHGMHSILDQCSSFNQDLSNWRVPYIAPWTAEFYGMTSQTLPLPNFGWLPNVPLPSEDIKDDTLIVYSENTLSITIPDKLYLRHGDGRVLYRHYYPDTEMYEYTSVTGNDSKVYIDMAEIASPSREIIFPNNYVNIHRLPSMNYMPRFNITKNLGTMKFMCDLPSDYTSFGNMFNNNPFLMMTGIEDWDTSNITSLDNAFNGCSTFNTNLSRWDTSNVTTMVDTFKDCVRFNQNLSLWAVSNITEMPIGFDTGAVAWTMSKPIWGTTPARWYVKSIQHPNEGITYVASPISTPGEFYELDGVQLYLVKDSNDLTNKLDQWTGAIDGPVSERMIQGQNGTYSIPVRQLVLTGVTDLSRALNDPKHNTFNQDVSTWDVSSVIQLNNVFSNKSSFNQDVSNWDVSSVISLTRTFFGCTAFNSDVSHWDVSKVKSLGQTFYGCETFNQDVSGWDVSNVTDMDRTFTGCKVFNQDISQWDVSSVANMDYMFSGCLSFNQDLSSWCVSNIPTAPNTFNNSPSTWTLPKPIWGTCPIRS